MELLLLIPLYLLGAFPTGKIIAYCYGVDVSKKGSGNIGATNLARVVGKKAGILTLIGDVGKGALGVFLARHFLSDPFFSSIAAITLVAGHCFSIPPWLRGGKGVATALGTFLILAPFPVTGALGIFLLIFFTFRYVSLASILGTLSAAIFAFLMLEDKNIGYAGTIIFLLVTSRHKDNILRLIEGTEAKFEVKRNYNLK